MSALLTTAETAERLKVSRKTVLALVERGKLSPVRLSKRSFRFPADQLEALATPTESEGGIGQ